MKTTQADRCCLCCGAPLSGQAEIEGWHTSCSKRFFGTQTLPTLDINPASLEGFARIAVADGESVTGVQKKLSLRLNTDTGARRLTLVGYPAGFILKPPAEEYPNLPELEHALMSLAHTSGIVTVPHALITFADGQRGYITRRIDRTHPKGNGPVKKIAMEDFCQLSQRLTEDKYKGSYEYCGKLISIYSCQPGLDMADFFYLLLFCFVTGNADMHLKNFSLIDSPYGYHLAPAYDLVPTALVLRADTEETALTIQGKKNRLSGKDFLSLGTNLGLNPKVVDSLMQKILALPVHAEKTGALSLLPIQRRRELVQLIKERCSRLGENTGTRYQLP